MKPNILIYHIFVSGCKYCSYVFVFIAMTWTWTDVAFIATNDIQLGLVLKAPLQKLPGFDKQPLKPGRDNP